MTSRSLARIIALLALVTACGGSQSPVPVVGRDVDISRLTGQWLGDYSSAETGRSGSIVFTLTAGSDTATGDVVMTPQLARAAAAQATGQSNAPLPSQTINIRFVRVSGGQVSGALAPYTDPSCSCPLHTTFVGRLMGDTLSGTFSSRHENAQDTQSGKWRVVRRSN